MVEMLVALMIAAIFFSVFLGVILATFETLRSGDERTVAQQNARVALNYIANDIRHATEIAPLRLEAYKDWATGGFPVDANTIDPFFGTGVEAWPIYRESVDSDPDGYIDLDIDGGTGDGDEYDFFRNKGNPLDSYGRAITNFVPYDDPYPYDVRALAPNRISLTFIGSTYFPNTEYWSGFELPIDIDNKGISAPNATSAPVRVTYEHQLVHPLGPERYEDTFFPVNDKIGRTRNFNMVVNRTDANSIGDSSDFVITRSFEIRNPAQPTGSNMTGDTSILEDKAGKLGAISPQLRIDQPLLRQPVADHVMSMRVRYWFIRGSEMFEIRYDPDMDHLGGNSVTTDDGYYRYYDVYGHEIYVWYNWITGSMVPLMDTLSPSLTDLGSIPNPSFVIYGGDTGDNEFLRGILLFEGWKFVNAISLTIKTANNQTLNIYRSTINTNIVGDPANPDWGMGLIDFGHEGRFTDATGTLNAFEPLYQGADNLRMSSTTVNGFDVFDFVEPNMNPNYDAQAFTTLQTFVTPPAIGERARRSVRSLGFGFRYE
jgi:type II secretory pathway pseudopilin PulG